MEETIIMIKLCQIGMNLFALGGIFWLGYLIGQEKVYKRLLEKNVDRLEINFKK